MHITILGAHNIESESTRCSSLLVDDVLALDAGALTSSLPFAQQQKLKAVLLTHQHYDHIRDIPALGMNFMLHKGSVELCTTDTVYQALSAHLVNETLYPDFFKRPEKKPALVYRELEAGKEVDIHGYRVLPVPVGHAVPTVGYQVTAPGGKKVFYTGDTGAGLADTWRAVEPDLLIIEVTAPNSYADFAREAGHLTPGLLKEELAGFKEMKGYLPRVVTVHMNPLDEVETRHELAAVAGALGADIVPGQEGMLLVV
jgi:ribonuclease BN (tRNA processing enzyme)